MDLTEQSITSGFRSQTDATCAAVTACRLMGFPVCLCVKFSLTRRLNISAVFSADLGIHKVKITGGEPFVLKEYMPSDSSDQADPRH